MHSLSSSRIATILILSWLGNALMLLGKVFQATVKVCNLFVNITKP